MVADSPSEAPLAAALNTVPGLVVRPSEPLARYTTFRIGGPAEFLVDIPSQRALIAVVRLARATGAPFHLLGLGSNVLIPDEGLSGIVGRLGGELKRARVRGDLVSAGAAPAAMARIDELNKMRWASLPAGQPNAGSIFKNPAGDYAGRLIEACGLKGLAIGGAEISLKHANVIVNTGAASANEVLTLMLRSRAAVRERFGIELRPEVVLAGSLRATWDGAGEPGASATPRQD